MGFFDKILKALGFEDEEQLNEDKKIEQKKEKKKTKSIKVRSKFNLEDVEEKGREVKHTPKQQSEIEFIIKDLIDGNIVYADFSELDDSMKIRALDFLSGAVYILNGSIEKQDNFLYILTTNKK